MANKRKPKKQPEKTLQIMELQKALQKSSEKPESKPIPEIKSEPLPEPISEIKSEPLPELLPEPISEPEKEPDPRQFKAVGCLLGKVSLVDQSNYLQIEINSLVYRLQSAPTKDSAFKALKIHVKKGGKELYVIVYPHFIHFPSKEKPPALSFQVVGFFEDVDAEWPVFEFRLAGFWQFIPVCRKPCISVFKNFSEERLEALKVETPDERYLKFLKASHLPMIWRDGTVKPFFYNPKLAKSEQGLAAFVELTARFIPDRECFEFVTLKNVYQDAPRFMRPPKAQGFKPTKTHLVFNTKKPPRAHKVPVAPKLKKV